MGRTLRSEQSHAGEVCIVHALQRCIRKAFLAGRDDLTGIDYSFRREWIRRRMEGSAYDRIQAERGEQIPSAAFDLVSVSAEQAGKHLRETSVADRKHQRRAKRRNPAGKQILRDRWFAPLTQSERKMADDPEVHRQGVRASDKGFLSLDWQQYLALLRWTAEQRVKRQVAKVPE